MEVEDVLRPMVKIIFLARAAFEVGRERVEDCFDAMTAKADEYKSVSEDHVQQSKDVLQEYLGEITQQIWQRSEVLEIQVRERIRRQIADFSLGALGDSTEINELRAEIATLRAEMAELKNMRTTV